MRKPGYCSAARFFDSEEPAYSDIAVLATRYLCSVVKERGDHLGYVQQQYSLYHQLCGLCGSPEGTDTRLCGHCDEYYCQPPFQIFADG